MPPTLMVSQLVQLSDCLLCCSVDVFVASTRFYPSCNVLDCFQIICGNCSENKAPLRYLMYKPARVCDECFEKLARGN